MVVELRNVRKTFGQFVAVRDLSLQVPRGAIVALLGPSGCGKSTTLRLIAGLEEPDTGEIILAERPVAGTGRWVPPEARQIGMVFQDYALFPYLTVAANVAFPLTKLSRRERDERVREWLTIVGLEPLQRRYPHELSGGQQQRVALARALAARPALVLLDEPFSNLDAALRQELREELRRILRAADTPAIFVTHDQEEAFSIADQIAVLDRGELLQYDTPRQLYRQPTSRTVAAFVGAANFIPGEASGDRVATALGILPLSTPAEGAVEVLLRPEAMTLASEDDAPHRVETLTYLGAIQIAQLVLQDGTTIRARLGPEQALAPGDRVAITVAGPVVAFSRGTA